MHPSNVWKSYSRVLERGVLVPKEAKQLPHPINGIKAELLCNELREDHGVDHGGTLRAKFTDDLVKILKPLDLWIVCQIKSENNESDEPNSWLLYMTALNNVKNSKMVYLEPEIILHKIFITLKLKSCFVSTSRPSMDRRFSAKQRHSSRIISSIELLPKPKSLRCLSANRLCSLPSSPTIFAIAIRSFSQNWSHPTTKLHSGVAAQSWCFVFFWKFRLPIGLHSSCSISPTASGTC